MSTLRKDYETANKDVKDYVGWSIKKIIVVIILVVIVLSILGFIGRIVLWPWFVANRAIDSAYDIADKTLDADNVIYNYEWFKQQVEDIKATENKREIAKQQILAYKEFAGDRTKWTFEDKTEYNRLNSVWQGISNHLEDLIATFNARSKMANRAIFQDGLIPNSMEFVADIIK